MANSPVKSRTPGVKFSSAVQRGFRRGVNQLVNAISPTLGPVPRHVVNQPMIQGKMPEFLDNGAVIARRIIMLPDRIEDVGAMYLRDMLWHVYETAGDGTATAAVLFRSIYDQGFRYVAAGGSAMRLRRHLEQAAQALVAALNGMTLPISGKEQLSGYAKSICHDADLSDVLAEAFDMLGVDGRLEIRAGRSRKLVLEFFDGVYWEGGLFSRDPVVNSSGKIVVTDPAILMTDLEIKEPQELLPLLDMACCAGIRNLVLLATKISERALSVLVLPANRRRIQVVAVKAPVNTVYREDLEDMAVLVGGRPLLEKAGDKLEAVRLDHLGRARRAWADKEYLGMEAGRGDPRKLRQHIAGLRQALARTQKDEDRKRLQQRLGQLIYGSAIVWIGATTPLELEMRKELAKRTMEAMRGALREGVLPGGGAALLDLRPVLQEKVRQAQDTDERAAYKLLQKAVEVPIRTLLNNSGHPPESILAQIARTHSGYGLDVTRGELRDMRQADIVDAASVVKIALGSAIQSAALALTIDVLIQRANPPMGIKRQ